MAKTTDKPKFETPSHFGSHSTMINAERSATENCPKEQIENYIKLSIKDTAEWKESKKHLCKEQFSRMRFGRSNWSAELKEAYSKLPNGLFLNDEFGETKTPYQTEKMRLDNNEADPNRYPTSRLHSLFAKKKEENDEQK